MTRTPAWTEHCKCHWQSRRRSGLRLQWAWESWTRSHAGYGTVTGTPRQHPSRWRWWLYYSPRLRINGKLQWRQSKWLMIMTLWAQFTVFTWTFKMIICKPDPCNMIDDNIRTICTIYWNVWNIDNIKIYEIVKIWCSYCHWNNSSLSTGNSIDNIEVNIWKINICQ